MTLYHSDGHSAGLLNQRVDKILFALSIDKAPEGHNLNMKAMKRKKTESATDNRTQNAFWPSCYSTFVAIKL